MFRTVTLLVAAVMATSAWAIKVDDRVDNFRLLDHTGAVTGVVLQLGCCRDCIHGAGQWLSHRAQCNASLQSDSRQVCEKACSSSC